MKEVYMEEFEGIQFAVNISMSKSIVHLSRLILGTMIKLLVLMKQVADLVIFASLSIGCATKMFWHTIRRQKLFLIFHSHFLGPAFLGIITHALLVYQSWALNSASIANLHVDLRDYVSILDTDYFIRYSKISGWDIHALLHQAQHTGKTARNCLLSENFSGLTPQVL